MIKMGMNERREKLFREVINRRQPDLAVVLENVHDPHNIGAVLRSCESVGILDVYLIQTEIPNLNAFKLGRKSSGGARKYIDLHVYNDLEEAVQLIKSRYKRLVGTHLGERASDLYDLN
jgi:tRNA (guanosine-2'-O-)-methyltransferase